MQKKFALLFFLFPGFWALHAAAINVHEYVMIGGIKQWITIKGENSTAPVLLFLHGGPGNSALSYSDQFTGSLQKKFLVVQWDQRGTGKTKTANDPPVAFSVALFENDAIELITLLRSRFSKEKIWLMGHSWGGFLGLKIAADHPKLLYGYFAISPMIWQRESERLTLEIMKSNALKKNDTIQQAELQRVRIPFESGTDLYLHRKWLGKLMGQRAFSGAFVEAWAVRWLPLFNEASTVNFFDYAPAIGCPVFFLIGDNDYQTYHKLAEQYYELLQAPEKKMFVFPGSAHSFLTAQQKKLQEIVIAQLP